MLIKHHNSIGPFLFIVYYIKMCSGNVKGKHAHQYMYSMHAHMYVPHSPYVQMNA